MTQYDTARAIAGRKGVDGKYVNGEDGYDANDILRPLTGKLTRVEIHYGELGLNVDMNPIDDGRNPCLVTISSPPVPPSERRPGLVAVQSTFSNPFGEVEQRGGISFVDHPSHRDRLYQEGSHHSLDTRFAELASESLLEIIKIIEAEKAQQA